MQNSQASTLDVWLPDVSNVKTSTVKKPVIESKAAVIYDLSTKETLSAKNATQKLPMASLTKIMTATIAQENKKENDKYVVSKSALVGEDSMGATEGEILSQEELLYGLILNSGNDAAEVFASNYPGGREKFIIAMNNKAKALGLTDTVFSNPSGLQGDGVQYTTARDLLAITEYALSHFPLFNKVVQTTEYHLAQTATHKAYDLYNETNLLTTYPGVKGVKTGYTPEAGLCLVTYLEYKNHKIIGVLLNSDNRRLEMKELLDYSLKTQGITPPAHQ